MIKHLLSLLFLSCFFSLQTTQACFLVPKKHVYITNNLPSPSPPLRYHCQSDDDDFGFKNLGLGKVFEIEFCLKPLSTLYYCHFWWKGKDKSFVVFDASPLNNRCKSKICYYSVRENGFYLSNDYPPQNFEKINSW